MTSPKLLALHEGSEASAREWRDMDLLRWIVGWCWRRHVNWRGWCGGLDGCGCSPVSRAITSVGGDIEAHGRD